jgi:cytidylate kinase
VIVTISREYGAGGLAVAEGLAQRLGYDLVSDDLSRSVAAKMGTSAEVASQATTGPSLPERILGNLGAGTAELQTPAAPRLPGDFDESLRRELEREIRERGARGDVVILGRSAAHILAGTPGLVRVFLTAAREWRIAKVCEIFGQTRDEAIADIERVDSARRKFTKERHKAVWGDARYYDLTIDSSRFDIEGTIDVIALAVRVAEQHLER